MELTEAVQRIVKHHLLLICAVVVLGMCVPVALQSGEHATDRATARLDIDPGGTTSVDEATSLSDAARESRPAPAAPLRPWPRRTRTGTPSRSPTTTSTSRR